MRSTRNWQIQTAENTTVECVERAENSRKL
jgi:hypothetical protein